jgi:hypothetical protein
MVVDIVARYVTINLIIIIFALNFDTLYLLIFLVLVFDQEEGFLEYSYTN